MPKSAHSVLSTLEGANWTTWPLLRMGWHLSRRIPSMQGSTLSILWGSPCEGYWFHLWSTTHYVTYCKNILPSFTLSPMTPRHGTWDPGGPKSAVTLSCCSPCRHTLRPTVGALWLLLHCHLLSVSPSVAILAEHGFLSTMWATSAIFLPERLLLQRAEQLDPLTQPSSPRQQGCPPPLGQQLLCSPSLHCSAALTSLWSLFYSLIVYPSPNTWAPPLWAPETGHFGLFTTSPQIISSVINWSLKLFVE